MTKPTVLISGAGIAGPSLAYWLTRGGYHVVLLEIQDGIRPGGQTVDLRGAGRAVIERMGLLDQMRARSLEQRGAAWVKADGRRRAEMPVEAFHGNGLVSVLEILRATSPTCCTGPPLQTPTTDSAPVSRSWHKKTTW